MESITPTDVLISVVNLAVLPLILWFIKHYLEKFDKKRDDARTERAELELSKEEQREAEHNIILAISRTMLLNNYERCLAKGCYTVDEREVYHELYKAYKKDGGNSIIDEIAPRIRALPMKPPGSDMDIK